MNQPQNPLHPMTASTTDTKNSPTTALAEPASATPAERFIEPRYTTRRVDEHTWELGIAVPGVKRDGVTVSLEKDELEVTARRTDDLPAGWRALHAVRPRPDGYRLELTLSVAVDPDRISAKLEDGILTLRLPVAENAKPRRISVE